jgi:hypothetical protein
LQYGFPKMDGDTKVEVHASAAYIKLGLSCTSKARKQKQLESVIGPLTSDSGVDIPSEGSGIVDGIGGPRMRLFLRIISWQSWCFMSLESFVP